MATPACAREHAYSDRTCVLPAGHDDGDDYGPHEAPDGFRWVHYEDDWEGWDEPEGPPKTGVEGCVLLDSSWSVVPARRVERSEVEVI